MDAISKPPKIVVLGGGFAGMFAAKQLERRIGWKADIELINETNYFVFQPLLPEVAAGSVTTREAVSPLRRLLPGVKIRQAHVFDVDRERQKVLIFQVQQRRQTEVSYDHLIVALGMGTDLSAVPGLSEHAMPMKTLQDAHRLRNHVIEKLEHADVTTLPEVKRQLLSFVVIGGGFSGVETVGEIRDLIDQSLPYYTHIDPSEVRVTLIEFADRLLGELPERLSSYSQKYFETKRGIEIKLKTGVTSATGTQLTTSNDEVIDTRTIVATIGNSPSKVVRNLNLPNERGRIRVDRHLKIEGFDNIWSLGDAALIPMNDAPKTRYDYAPPTAQFAVQEAKCLARNIGAALDGEALQQFKYKTRGALASLGGQRGVAEVFGVRVTGFFAWVLWRSYYLSIAPGFATKIRIAMSWFLDQALGRNTVQSGIGDISTLRHVRYAKGDRVFEAGNRADGLYIVKSGEFALSVTESGKTVTYNIGPGGHFGARALLHDKQRIGSVRAREDSEVLIMKGDDFKALIAAIPPLNTYFEEYLDSIAKQDVLVESGGG